VIKFYHSVFIPFAAFAAPSAFEVLWGIEFTFPCRQASIARQDKCLLTLSALAVPFQSLPPPWYQKQKATTFRLLPFIEASVTITS
jgi:hypothetical protein